MDKLTARTLRNRVLYAQRRLEVLQQAPGADDKLSEEISKLVDSEKALQVCLTRRKQEDLASPKKKQKVTPPESVEETPPVPLDKIHLPGYRKLLPKPAGGVPPPSPTKQLVPAPQLSPMPPNHLRHHHHHHHLQNYSQASQPHTALRFLPIQAQDTD